MYLSHILCARPAGGRPQSEMESSHLTADRQKEEPNESPHPPRKNYKCSSFVTASVAFLMGVVVLKYIGIFLISRSWQCIILDTPWVFLRWRTHWCHQILKIESLNR